MSSQFAELFKARNEAKLPAKKKTEKPKKATVGSPPPAAELSETPAIAKSKNSEFEQALIYLKKTTKKEVKKSLLDDPSGRNFSDLVEELLTNWLKTKK
jgi:hypothetical protein